jgi:hypothetical protein
MKSTQLSSILRHSSPESELQLKPQQTREQSPPPDDLENKHDGGECLHTEEDKVNTNQNQNSPHLEHPLELQQSPTESPPPHDLESKHDGEESILHTEETVSC